MKPIGFAARLGVGMSGLALSLVCGATTIQTEGSGSAVTSTDRLGTFNTLTSSNAVNLDTYAEDGLSVTTASTSWGEDPTLATMDPFHGAGGADRAFYAMANGSDTWVTIQTTDSLPIFGVEFVYGNTWTTGDIFGQYPWGNHLAEVDWETWRSGTMVSSGTIGPSPLLEMGTILGFSDPSGFDQLLVRSIIPPDMTLQAIALDNLKIQLSPSAFTVPEPATSCLLGLGLASLIWMRRLPRQPARGAAINRQSAG